MDIEPKTRTEHFLARAAGDENALALQPKTRLEHLLQNLIDAIKEGGGGGSVTPASIVTATGQMTEQQAADTLDNIGGEKSKLVVTVTKSSNVLYADKTFAEIEAAVGNKKTVVVTYDGITYGLVRATTGLTYGFSVSECSGAGNVFEAHGLEVGNDDAWEESNFVGQDAPTVTTVSGSTPTIEPAANTIYNCGELTSLTISNPPATGSYSIVFTSGSTATTTTIPATILGLESFAAEANTMYEINVLDNRAVVGSWAVTP